MAKKSKVAKRTNKVVKVITAIILVLVVIYAGYFAYMRLHGFDAKYKSAQQEMVVRHEEQIEAMNAWVLELETFTDGQNVSEYIDSLYSDYR